MSQSSTEVVDVALYCECGEQYVRQGVEVRLADELLQRWDEQHRSPACRPCGP